MKKPLFRHSPFNFSRLIRRQDSSRGQALILLAVAFVALLAFVGLVVDGGMVYIYMGQLRRAVDASGLAAASQFREQRTITEMTSSAQQVLKLNGIDSTTVVVETCTTNPTDTELCPQLVNPSASPRKLVRVTAYMDSPTFFMSLFGISTVRINANSISEAASMDVVLVIDISETMAYYDASNNHRDVDPAVCNANNTCYPFAFVKSAAKAFADRILAMGDGTNRMAIVTFANGWQADPNSYFQKDPYGNLTTNHAGYTRVRGPIVAGVEQQPAWISDKATADAMIDNLKVYDPGRCPNDTTGWTGPCTAYTNDTPPVYYEQDCPNVNTDATFCTTTDIGGGLLQAGDWFANNSVAGMKREDSVWVTVLLTDGAANSTDPIPYHQFGLCPSDTKRFPYCRQLDSRYRHINTDAEYDGYDYARDMADFVGCDDKTPALYCSQTGQKSVIYTIGLGGELLMKYDSATPPATYPNYAGKALPVPMGVRLLRYVAAVGDDGDVSTDICADQNLYATASGPDPDANFKTNCGNYYYAATGLDLDPVFESIYSRMFVRINH